MLLYSNSERRRRARAARGRGVFEPRRYAVRAAGRRPRRVAAAGAAGAAGRRGCGGQGDGVLCANAVAVDQARSGIPPQPVFFIGNPYE